MIQTLNGNHAMVKEDSISNAIAHHVACCLDKHPDTSGRLRVRRTLLSKFWSEMSLKQHPADLHKIAPNVNVKTILISGWPPAANHSAVSVGHSNSRVPVGLSKRVSFEKYVKR